MREFELLAKLRERLPAAGPRVRLGGGDDAAVTVPGGATRPPSMPWSTASTSRRQATEPAQVGGKALATALSDLAAMGAETGEAYVAVGVPPTSTRPSSLALLDGIACPSPPRPGPRSPEATSPGHRC